MAKGAQKYKPDPAIEAQRRQAEIDAAAAKKAQVVERKQERTATRLGLRGFRGLLSAAGELGFPKKRIGP